MADNPDANNVELDIDSEADIAKIKAQYKANQRSGEKQRKKMKADLDNALDIQSHLASISRIEERLDTLFTALGKSDILDESTRAGLAEHAAQTKTQTSTFQAARQARKDIEEVAAEIDADWETDERFASARRAWDGGRYDEAVQLAQKTVLSPTSMKAMIEAELARHLKVAGKVDVGSGTGGVGIGTMTTAQIAEKLRGPDGREFWKANGAEIKKKFPQLIGRQ